MSDDNLWRKIDEHTSELADIKQRFAVVDSRVTAIESRFDTMMQLQAEGRAEVRQMLKELHTDLSALRADYIRSEGVKAGRDEVRKEMTSWKERFLSNLPAIVAMLLALGWINGVSTGG